MQDKKVIAAIDMGSNAIRMIIGEFSEQRLHILRKMRAPLRLGHDVFANGKISEPMIQEVNKALRTFRATAKSHGVSWIRAVATSAVRESKNSAQFIKKIKSGSEIHLELIDGLEEARLIHLGVSKVVDLYGKKAVLIDVGGGSVEVTLVHGQEIMASRSFPLGTVRVLEEMERRNLSEENIGILIGELILPLNEYLLKYAKNERFDFGIGTGGNLDCMADLKDRILNRKPAHYLTLDELFLLSKEVRKIPLGSRTQMLGLRKDRTDVIVPAILVVKAILRQTDAHRVLIPKVGLRDGILWSMVHDRFL